MPDIEEVWESLRMDPALVGGQSFDEAADPLSFANDEELKQNADRANKGGKLGDDVKELEVFEDEFGNHLVKASFSARHIHTATVKGRTIVARCVQYSVGNIGWRAGKKWPLYRSTQPRHIRANNDFAAPGLYQHSLVLGVGGVARMLKQHGGTICGHNSSPVRFGVNDGKSHYGDNSGGFELYITGWY